MITQATQISPGPRGPNSPAEAALNSPVLSAAFGVNLLYTFLLFSRAVEFIDTTGKLHLAVLTGGACILAVIATGAFPRMLLSRQGKWLSFFSFWIFAGLPFSMWKGGSVHDFTNTWLKTYTAFFLIGGLIFSLAQFRKMIFAIAAAACCQIYFAIHASTQSSDDRLSMTYGTLGNANDLASSLLMGLPFIAFFLLDKKANIFLRAILAVPFVLLLVVVLKTGSRGGLVSAFVLCLAAFFSSSAVNKARLLMVGVLAAALFLTVVPRDLRDRYMTILKSSRDASTSENAASALDSSNARSELLKHSLILTLKHPVFGVGLGQFAPQSANLWIEKGQVPLWFTSHDIYGLVSAEIGIPGLILYLILIAACFRTLWRLAKARPLAPEAAALPGMAYCVLMSLLAFTVCGIFSTAAYTFQLPMLAALTAALHRNAAPYLPAKNRFRLAA